MKVTELEKNALALLSALRDLETSLVYVRPSMESIEGACASNVFFVTIGEAQSAAMRIAETCDAYRKAICTMQRSGRHKL